MSEKSDFQIAFEDFQKEVTNLLLEEAACSPYFRESATFPLPPPPPPLNNSESKNRARKTNKAPKEEAENNQEKEEPKEKEVKEKEEKEEKKWTTDEIDEEIIISSKRTQADLTSGKFMRNLKKRIKNVDRQIIKDRIDILLNEGKIVQKNKEE